MAIVVGGTTVTGTQTVLASVLTGTASAINGSNITNLPAPSSANVASATAGIGIGVVGSYAACAYEPGNGVSPGSTTAGSNLKYSNFNDQRTSGTNSGTWRCMGYSLTSSTPSATATMWLRIS